MEAFGSRFIAQTFGIPVVEHCEVMALAHGGSMHEGVISARLGLKGIPGEAEEIDVIRCILLAKLTGGHIHLCHLSTKTSVDLVRWLFDDEVVRVYSVARSRVLKGMGIIP